MAIIEQGLDAQAQPHLLSVLSALSPLELGDQMADVLIESMPEFARSPDPDFRTGLVLSCQSNLNSLWQLLRADAPFEEITPPPEAIAWAHELVHRGFDLAPLLRAYRLGHGLAERRFDEVAAELEIPPELRWRVSAHATRYFFAYIDTVCTQLVHDYETERARWIRGAAAARAELVAAIIRGDDVDPRDATATLRYDVNRRHLGFIVWTDTLPRGAGESSASLEAAAASIAAELGGGPTLTIQIGERSVWAWTHWADDDTLEAADGLSLGDGHRAALGTPASGLDGMRRSHEEARAARRVADLMGARPGSIIPYRAAALTALLTADPSEAVRFAESQLGQLAGDEDALTRLRATVRVYLEENMSPARTARRLGIHQNTVVYRVKRAEEILGREVSHSHLELGVALRLSEGLAGLRSAVESKH
jgi:DNA-binding PucR family transcriptional regulator